MNEFKGTKGKWKLVENDYGYFTSVRNLDDTRKVVVSRVNNQTESNANMLLISKSPEMLEFIIEVMETTTDDRIYKKAKDLIKEATENIFI
jgi:hypothetical protein